MLMKVIMKVDILESVLLICNFNMPILLTLFVFLIY